MRGFRSTVRDDAQTARPAPAAGDGVGLAVTADSGSTPGRLSPPAPVPTGEPSASAVPSVPVTTSSWRSVSATNSFRSSTQSFRPVAQPGMTAFRSTAQLSARPAAKPLVELVVEELAAGRTVVQVAQDHSLPRDFVELVVQRAKEQGSLNYFELTKGSCTTGRCDPDPESLVCAGCPVLPAAVRRRQSWLGKLTHRQ